jgi:enoyl-CoA hydratase
MDYEFLKFSVASRVATVTLNRPKALNAINSGMLVELMGVFSQIKIDPDIHAAILTGAGKAFCAGADIKEMIGKSPVQVRDYTEQGQQIFAFIEELQKPVIAAVNGYAFGGGSELALACTFRYAATTAQFAQPEVKIGVIPGWGGTRRLTEAVGRGKALEMMLTGEPITAKEALRVGLVNVVTPKAQLMKKVRSVARKIGANAPQAVKLALNSANADNRGGLYANQQLEASIIGLLAASKDRNEGIAAFIEKRKPKFTNE